MRIISGIARGRRIQVPATNDVRPTTDRVREALFSHLGHRIPGSRALDLFAGSGALGLEALSRGALSATFVEQSRAIYSCLANNINTLGFAKMSSLHMGDALKWLKKPATGGLAFDLIFLDPPYHLGLLAPVLGEIARHRWLTPEGLIITEHSAAPAESRFDIPAELQIVRTRQYGKTAVTTLTWMATPNDVPSR
ncbi:MAG: 16S rRNA (guanine(966)-N(2))-methyltransferase RsmD [Deltaproteobacteria bacterium]|nr:16S rRNA (guanine(966)-N(2))-methyltransferase RsmD [Deltaproteobacteria bacterium]